MTLDHVSSDPISVDILLADVDNYRAGNISLYLYNWFKLTSDSGILDIVQNGLKMEFIDKSPTQTEVYSHPVSILKQSILDEEIAKLLQKKVIVETTPEPDEFISPIFTRAKKDGTYRMILNLKHFNKHICYKHFKMESIQNVIDIVKPGVWIAKVDLKDAFFTILIYAPHKKYLRFVNQGIYYKFAAMPNGYGPAMRAFSKVLKPPFAVLRENGQLSVVFVDDIYLQGDTFDECQQNVWITIAFLRSLGFTIHVRKSILIPTQLMIYAGFWTDTIQMTLQITEEKADKIVTICTTLLNNTSATIQEVA